MRLLITRAEADAADLKADLALIGHEGVIEPLLTIEFDDCDRIELSGVQALIATSRNGLRALARRPARIAASQLPLFAVGSASAGMARQMGFAFVHQGPGRAVDLIPLIKKTLVIDGGRLLHLAGAALAGDIAGPLRAAGFDVVQPVVYRARSATGLSAQTLSLFNLGKIDGVILMSPRTAGIYADLITAGGLAEAVCKLAHFCLSEAVAARLGPLGDLNALVAAAPDRKEILALMADSSARLR